jgi:hypothetical protein
MDRALWKLYRLRWRGSLRRMLRGFKTWRGLLLTAAGIVMFALWLGPPLVQAAVMPRLFHPTWAQQALPWLLFVSWLIQFLAGTGEQAIAFTLPEVEFLFAGPFRRRELLVYKLVGMGLNSFAMGLIFATACLQWVTYWIAAFLGIWLTVIFFQLLNMAFALFAQWLGQVAFSRTRRIILIVLGLLLVLGAGRAVLAGRQTPVELATAFRDSWAGWVVLAPFEVFTRSITATSLGGEFALWLAAGGAINLLLAAVVLGLDANYLEASAHASQKKYAALQRWRSGGSWRASPGRLRVPRFGWWAGAGPMAWRQTVQLLRSRALLASLIMFVVMAGVACWLAAMNQEPSGPDPGGRLAPILMMLFMMNFMVVASFPFGFRADLDRMDWLKVLPLKPTAIVIGQALPLVTWLCVSDVGVLAAMGLFDPRSAEIAWIFAALAPPFVVVLVTLESFLFLLFPTRDLAMQTGDFQAYGKYMVLFALRAAALGCCAAPAAIVGAVIYFLTQSWPLCLTGAGAVLMVEAAIFVVAAAWAFRRFDVSLDTPGG